MLELGEEFGSNESAEKDGVWVSLGEGAQIKVARLGNSEAQRAYRKIPRAMRRMIEDGVLDNKQASDFLAGFLSNHILKGWEGLADKGKPLGEITPESAKSFMIKYRRFRDRVMELSQDDDLFNVEVEEDIKNSPKLSSGS